MSNEATRDGKKPGPSVYGVVRRDASSTTKMGLWKETLGLHCVAYSLCDCRSKKLAQGVEECHWSVGLCQLVIFLALLSEDHRD